MADGIVLLNKSAGKTSFASLYPLKKALGKKTKVGHTGTLDLFAEGLMVILVGKATRLNTKFTHFDKEYVATICFGQETDTLDPSGQVVKQSDCPNLSSINIEKILQGFLGEQQQIPPVFSAIKMDGKRASDRTREGEQVQMQSRTVHFYKIEILGSLIEEEKLKELTVKVACSKGTYIRSFARDVALAMASCGHLKSLTRTKVGSFKLENAIKAEEFDPSCHIIGLAQLKELVEP